MAAYFVCLTAGGGVPLFSRTRGGLKTLPFPVIGSLNGVHMFASNHGTELLSTVSDTAKVVWRVYHSSLTLVLVSEDDAANDAHLAHVLDIIFQAMVLLYGLEDLTNIKNIERFKREIKVCYRLIDCLLEQATGYTFGPLVRCVDVIAAPENAILQTFLEALVETAASPYGCLLVRGRVAVATSRWWSLTAAELTLLPLLLHSLPAASSRDLPVFLPDGSPKVPHRLLTFTLVPGVEVCTLCGPAPSLAELEREVIRFWRTSLDSLRAVLRQKPFPPTTNLDHNLLGFILLNRNTHRCLSSVEPHDQDNRHGWRDTTPSFMPMSMWDLPIIREDVASTSVSTAPVAGPSSHPSGNNRPSPSGGHHRSAGIPRGGAPAAGGRGQLAAAERRRILAAFYRTVVGTLWPLPRSDSSTTTDSATGNGTGGEEDTQQDKTTRDAATTDSQMLHTTEDTYICADTHKCYAHKQGPYQLFALYHIDTPTYAMRSVTSKTLLALTQDKNVSL